MHKVGDLVYDKHYREVGVIIKIWTPDEIKNSGMSYEYCTHEVEFVWRDETKMLATDRYPSEFIEEMKEQFQKHMAKMEKRR